MESAADNAPLTIARQGWFYVGGSYDADTPDGADKMSGHMSGQMYVEYQIPHIQTCPFPIVMIHGGQQNGTNWTGTPDGREGWAQYFLRRGYAVYVVDQVARGRSAHNAPDKHGALAPLNRDFADKRFIRPEDSVDWPQAALHTQWPGAPHKGDDAYDQFIASQAPSLADYAMQQRLNSKACIALLDRIGKSIVMVHSQSGAFGWVIADQRPQLVATLIALEPNGPPVRDVSNIGAPDWFEDTGRWKVSGLGDVQLTWEPPLRDGETLAWTREDAPQRKDCVRCWSQSAPARRLPNLAQVKIMMLSADASYHAPYDHCTAQFLQQAGAAVDHIRLADHGITGTGHMLMIEKTSHGVAGVVHDWLKHNLQ